MLNRRAPHGLRKTPLCAPSLPKALSDDARRYVNNGGPLLKAARLSVQNEPQIIPLIVILLGACGPSAVSLAVWPGVFDALKCQAHRSFSHIFQKLLEIIPLRIIGNAPTAIILVAAAVFVGASPLHFAPGTIGARLLTLLTMAVPVMSLCTNVFSPASTRLRVKSAQIGTVDRDASAASTSASPLLSFFGPANNRKPAKCQAGQISRFGYSGFGHRMLFHPVALAREELAFLRATLFYGVPALRGCQA